MEIFLLADAVDIDFFLLDFGLYTVCVGLPHLLQLLLSFLFWCGDAA